MYYLITFNTPAHILFDYLQYIGQYLMANGYIFMSLRDEDFFHPPGILCDCFKWACGNVLDRKDVQCCTNSITRGVV